jgi:cytochrome c
MPSSPIFPPSPTEPRGARAGGIAAAVLAAAMGAAPVAAQPVQGTTSAVELGDVAHGAEVFEMECAACHEMGEDARNTIGPHLNRIFARRAAGVDGFDYSDSIRRMGADGLVWDLRTLNAYIANPRSLVSGTTMGYPGLDDPTDRADLIAYLRVFSDRPQDIPEALPTARRIWPVLPPEVLALQGDVEYGEYLATECTTCHQRDGGYQGIPGIVGWPEEFFVLAMHAYREGLRPHQVMQMVARRLNDEEIAALAAYFSDLQD